MDKIVLASLSPRRKELLEATGLSFIIDSSYQEELLNASLPLENRLMDLAYQKALPLLEKYPDALIIGADTVVVFNNQVLGKPKDYIEAYQMLESFSGNKQYVYSAVALLTKEKHICFIDQSDVVFKTLSDQEIKDYLAKNEWQDKAGGYAIQGEGRSLIDMFNGDYTNIVGLPMIKLKNELKTQFQITI